MNFTNLTFINKTINLDDNVFENCSFVRCYFIFEGGKTGLAGCTFIEPRFSFAGAASRTLGFMAAMYKDGAQELVEKTFDIIRKGDSPDDDILNQSFFDW